MYKLYRLSLLLLLTCIQPVAAGMTERTGPDGITYFSPETQHQVIMYGVPDCGYCKQARKFFADQGVEYVEYNINRSAKRLREFRRFGGRGTPLIRIDGKTIKGFNRAAIEAALN